VEDHTEHDEISLLDIAVVIAENWLLLILVPLLAGAIAYGVISWRTTEVYETEALLAIDEREAALVQSAPVLDKVMLESETLTVTKDADSGFYRLRVRGEDPRKAEELLSSIIDALITGSVPNPVELARINREIEQASASLEELENGLANVNAILAATDEMSGTSAGELGAAVVSLVSNIEQRRAELYRLELAKEGSVRPEDVLQPPTSSVSVGSRGTLMPVVAVVLGTGFLLLIFAFVREGFRKASNDPAKIGQVNRIRRAFWLKPIAVE
jgi:uncharacterized protein involved in exopolysaccharide biosynthesis